MAERRMFAKTIVTSDAFLDMPISARFLYFMLGMYADDDGFVNSPKSIARQCGATTDDLNILAMRKFIIAFEDGVIVIKHWKINNYIQKDRYVATKYEKHKLSLGLDENNAYTECIQDVYGMYTQVSIGKVSLDKDSILQPTNILGNKVVSTHTHTRDEVLKHIMIDLRQKQSFDLYKQIQPEYVRFVQEYYDILLAFRNDEDAELVLSLSKENFDKILEHLFANMLDKPYSERSSYVWKCLYNLSKERDA